MAFLLFFLSSVIADPHAAVENVVKQRLVLNQWQLFKILRAPTHGQHQIVLPDPKVLFLHQFPSSDSQVQMVSQKLLDCETANIRQMQGYL